MRIGIFKRTAFVVQSSFFCMFLLVSCGQGAKNNNNEANKEIKKDINKDIALVQNGHFTNFPTKSIGQAVNGFIGNPVWESGTGVNPENKPIRFVNCRGAVTYMGKPVQALIQFVLSPDGQSFSLQAFELNEIPQNQEMIGSLIQEMFKGTESVQNASTSNKDNEKPSKTYDLEQFKTLTIGKTKKEIIKLLGKPESTQIIGEFEYYYYKEIVYDKESGVPYGLIQIAFINGVAAQINAT